VKALPAGPPAKTPSMYRREPGKKRKDLFEGTEIIGGPIPKGKKKRGFSNVVLSDVGRDADCGRCFSEKGGDLHPGGGGSR